MIISNTSPQWLHPDSAASPVRANVDARLDRLIAVLERQGDRRPSIAIPETSREDRSMPQPARTANAGNVHIEPPPLALKPSVFGRAAISLQNLSNMATDYGVRAPQLHAMTSLAKVASYAAGDTHVRSNEFASRGIRGDGGGDVESILRTIEANTRRPVSVHSDAADAGMHRNDLKDSMDGLKEAIDNLKDAIKTQPQSGGQQSASGMPVMNSQQPQRARSVLMPSGRPPMNPGAGPHVPGGNQQAQQAGLAG